VYSTPVRMLNIVSVRQDDSRPLFSRLLRRQFVTQCAHQCRRSSFLYSDLFRPNSQHCAAVYNCSRDYWAVASRFSILKWHCRSTNHAGYWRYVPGMVVAAAADANSACDGRRCCRRLCCRSHYSAVRTTVSSWHTGAVPISTSCPSGPCCMPC